jgi:hypothetical protein
VHADAQAQPVGLRAQRVLDRDAQRSACTALAKATKKPSPVVLNTRPSCAAASGSTTSARSARTRASVLGSSAPTMAE